MSSKISVVICDDEAPYRNALQKTLNMVPDCEVVGVCKDGAEALELCQNKVPNVLLTDINMPRMNGLELIRRLLRHERNVAVVVLTIDEDQDTIFDAFRYGAMGYLLKTSTPQEVIDAVKHAHQKEVKITPKIATKIIDDFRRLQDDGEDEESPLFVLSEREIEILDLIVKGKRNREIAEMLNIAEKTVKNHVSNILRALQVNSRTEAAMKAIKVKLVDGP